MHLTTCLANHGLLVCPTADNLQSLAKHLLLPSPPADRSEVRATSGKGFARLMAEHEWGHLYYNYQMPVHIFRCGGIYGPRRSALEAVQQRGLPSASQRRRARQQYTSRVHVYDICQTLEASIKRPNPGGCGSCAEERAPWEELSWGRADTDLPARLNFGGVLETGGS